MRAVSTVGEIVSHATEDPFRATRGAIGCQLATRLAKTVCEQLELSMNAVTYLSDSTTALWWIRGEPRNFRPFVANRVSDVISESDPAQWHHVRTELDVADIATRGVPASSLQADSWWIRGPEFLWAERAEWLIDDVPSSNCPTAEVELKKKVFNVRASVGVLLDPAAYSSWNRLLLVTSWPLRYRENLCNRNQRKSGPLTVHELKEAEQLWIQWAQHNRFHVEIDALSSRLPIPPSSRIASLDPRLVDGVLRVGGRMDKAEIPWSARHPIILDHGHDVTRLIVLDYHRRLTHAGVEHVFNHVSEKIWIVRGRAEVKHCTIKCPLCHRRRVRPMTQRMSDLPSVRLRGIDSPFHHVGLDYVGRNRVEKQYICLFTCVHARAVHLEVAHSLDTDSCIMALRRFQARLGNPTQICSDNGCNFVGAERELREALAALDQRRIADELAPRGVRWNFNPPAAPWFGGAWEALVKSTKRTMKVIFGEVLTVDEVFVTVIAEAESLLNLRPLVYGGSSSSSTDVSARTSANLAPGEFVERDMSLRRRWRHSQFLVDQLWHRWRREYVPQLAQRIKWRTIKRNLCQGDLVLLVEENVPRGRWLLGRVLAPIASAHGLIRTAEVTTKSGTYVRLVGKLALLEAHLEEEQG